MKRSHLNSLSGLILLVLFIPISCHVPRAIFYNKPDVKDYKRLPAYQIQKSTQPFQFLQDPAADQSQIMDQIARASYSKRSIDTQFLKDAQTICFIVIRNDSLIYEQYFDGYSRERESAVFSMAKSFLSGLTGIAIEEGFIQSIHDPIIQYLPELDSAVVKGVTIRHLLNMDSGLDMNWKSYLSINKGPGRMYYGTDVCQLIWKGGFLYREAEPGSRFKYSDVNAQLLGAIVERATGKTLAQYLEEKVWSVIGTTYDAQWAIADEEHQMTKAYCCLSGRAIDFAKFGRLYLQGGRWGDKQLIPGDWVANSLQALKDSPYKGYSYMWWHSIDKDKKPRNDAMTRGLYGQYVYVQPEKNLILVRLGKSNGYLPSGDQKRRRINWRWVLSSIAEQL